MPGDEDVEITFVKAGGPGGQHRNKRETGVRILHKATGIVVTATERRERPQNLALAWTRLAAALKKHRHKPKRRRKTRPTRASIERRLDAKARRARLKRGRGATAD